MGVHIPILKEITLAVPRYVQTTEVFLNFIWHILMELLIQILVPILVQGFIVTNYLCKMRSNFFHAYTVNYFVKSVEKWSVAS